MGDQPLLIALVAIQFLVHALGWGMAAQLTGRLRAAEGHFALFWLLIAFGLTLYVPPWPSGSAPRNVGDLMIIGAMAVQHRGMSVYWGQRPADRSQAILLLLAALVVGLSLLGPNGHGVRVAVVCIGAGLCLFATVRLVWRHGRADMPVFARVVAAGYGLMAIALIARAVQALRLETATKISIDAPGHLNVPLAILVMFVGGLINIAQIRLVLGRVLQGLTAQAQTDALTGALNRRGMGRRLDDLHARARERAEAYAVLMVDVDHFKVINDQHGHAVGDEVLKRVALGLRQSLRDSLRDSLRADDVVSRWGGEEFCVLLPRVREAEAQALAERMVAVIARSGSPAVTISIGVALVLPADAAADGVMRRADAALYRAKDSGRNRVCVAAAAD
jgi:diguanylate cyclase (GGDEF)-like protein